MLSALALVSVQSAGYHARPLIAQPARPALRRGHTAVCTAAVAADADLVGDGGVLKRVVRPGSGATPMKGDAVEVHYDGTLLATGARFDSSRERGKTFKFTLGEGKVIGGWEVGVASMKPGERSVLTCSPSYAYGDKGIPPIIPPASALQFEVELLSVQAAPKARATIAEDNPENERTPQTIQAAYEKRMAAMPAKKEGLEGLIEWAKGIYVFGLFSKNAERPPWYLNPLITFPAIFVVVGFLFYATVGLGGLHRGEVPMAGDDLSGFIDETPLPGSPGARMTYEQLMSSSVQPGGSIDRALQAAEKPSAPPVVSTPPVVATPPVVSTPPSAVAPPPQVVSAAPAAAPAAAPSPVFPTADGPAAELKALEAQLAAL